MTNASARQLAERLTQWGMTTEERAAEVLASIDKWGDGDDSSNDPLDSLDLLSYLPEFGVAVSIHVDDVDFVDDYYRSILEEDIAGCTDGAVVVTDVTLLETEDGDEWLYFVRNGEPVWWSMEHESQDYVDMLSVIEQFDDLDPGGDDPRSFHLHCPERPETGRDQVFLFATREQALALRDEFGINFYRLDRVETRDEERPSAADLLAEWNSGMDQRLRQWHEAFTPAGLSFDFSLGSLDALERLVRARFADRAALRAEASGSFVTGAIAYLGETLIRAESAAWDYRAGFSPSDRDPVVVSGTPRAFAAVLVPLYLLERVADKREFGVLAEAADELRETSQQYAEALRALESDEDEDDEDDFD